MFNKYKTTIRGPLKGKHLKKWERAITFLQRKEASIDPNLNGDWYLRPMPTSSLPPVFRKGPLNLNSDGTKINYKKSHQGPNAMQWAQADADEMERLFKSGTLRPIMHCDIPPDKNATYVNPVCSEKMKDDDMRLELKAISVSHRKKRKKEGFSKRRGTHIKHKK